MRKYAEQGNIGRGIVGVHTNEQLQKATIIYFQENFATKARIHIKDKKILKSQRKLAKQGTAEKLKY